MSIPYPISEIADRYTICRLKSERTNEDMSTELKIYINEITKHSEIWQGIETLYEINGKIWDLESDIRQGREGELGLEEVGRRAIAIRELNKKRVLIKNSIVGMTGHGFKDIKINHASD